MDATLSDAPALPGSPSTMPPRARLPGEDDQLDAGGLRAPTPEAGDRLAAAPPRRSRRGALMSTVGIVFLLGSVSAMGYMQRAELERIPAVQHVLAALHVGGLRHPASAVVADIAMTAGRAARPLAHALKPLNDGTVQAPPANAAASAAAVTQAPAAPEATVGAPHAQKAQLAQFDALKSGTPAPATSPAAAPSGTVPASPTAPAPPAVKVAQSAPYAAAGTAGHAAPPAAAKPGPAPASAQARPAPVPANPVAQAVAMRAAPMTDPEQLDVLHLVTQLGVLVRDQRTEIADLRGEVSDLSDKVNAQLTDFDRRLSVAEARGAIAAAMGAGRAAPVHTAAVTVAPHPAPAASAKTVAPAAPPPLVRSVSDYHIQAASPGLAMLSTADDGGSSIQVGVGDEVPGIGQVLSIYQTGNAWVVKTDHGVIR